MAVDKIAVRSGTSLIRRLLNAVGLQLDSADNKLKFNDYSGSAGTVRSVVTEDQTQTLTNKTLTSPVINGATGGGAVVTKSCLLTENGAATSYTATFAIPAGAVLHNIRVIAQALWNGTSATLKVGDTADDDGYFIGVNLKATDLLVGEVLSVEDGDLWGGKNGAYLVSGTGQRGPVATNFGQYYAAGSNITAIVTPGAADGTLGRTLVEVEYSIPTNVAQVVV
jgi:hypothetical protein